MLDNGFALGFIGVGIEDVGVEVPETSGESVTGTGRALWPSRQWLTSR
jgi:hypothetical protein